MLKLIRYFFYVQYKFSLSNGVSDSGWAATMVTFFLIANTYLLTDVFSILFRLKYSDNLDIIVVIGVLLLFLLSYKLFQQGNKPQKILEEFDRASKREKNWLNIFLVLYIVLSIGLVIYTGNIIRSGDYLK